MSSAVVFVTPYMFLGMAATSSVIQAADDPGDGASARPKALVVLVKTKRVTLAATASSNSTMVPFTFVSTNTSGS
jgi:hypothetical protein